MPDLKTPMHLNMLKKFEQSMDVIPPPASNPPKIYGMQWGDPDVVIPLKFIRDRYVLPYVNPKHVALEIGPGGGRWTQYLLGFKRVIAVDYYAELLDELRKNFDESNMVFIKNNGTDFPGVTPGSVDYIISFGTFVHLDIDLIEAYVKSMKEVIKPGANVVIQYSDKTKVMAQINEGFSANTPEKMRRVIISAGYRIIEEDLTTLWHSSVVRFAL